ncbi:MAG: aromatic ring-hydroxylating dioxygenase subunit alpha [Pseudomonadota bacterium]
MTVEAASGHLTGLWYVATASRSLRPGQMLAKEFLGRPIVLGRDRGGRAFALEDLCPHRGVRLSEGGFDGETLVCPFHGWRFGVDGACTRIPSLVDGQSIDLGKIRTKLYRCTEQQGLVWVLLDCDGAPAPKGEPPQIPGIGDRQSQIATELVFETDMDNAVFGLLDPAHGPYVHQSRLWRSPDNLRQKEKAYAPSPLGFTMTRHAPSSNSVIYRFLGGAPTTEISFQLPGLRIEHIEIGAHHICNVTAMTPIDDRRTQVANLLYWTNPLLNLARPFMRGYARKFLSQDRDIIGLQNDAARFQPKTMLVPDADAPQRWYLRLKREWRAAQAEGRAFHNPIEPTTLRWRT